MRQRRTPAHPPQATPVAMRLALGAALLATALHAALATEPSLPYTVQPGDKLIILARDMLVKPGDWPEVARFNALPDPDVIHPGQTVKFPLRLLKFVPVNTKVVSVQGQVQVGNAPATVGQAIGEGGRLQTGADSSAVVELPDGSRVQLMPATVAEVVASRNYLLRDATSQASQPWFAGVVRVSLGAVETLASKLGLRATPLQIQTPTTVAGVRGTRFRVAHESSTPNSRAEVLEGEVRADNTAQQTGADLPKGTGAVIDPTRKEVKAVPLLPAPDLSLLPNDITSAQAAAWPMPAAPGAVAYRVQVAPDSQFERIVRDVKVTAATTDLSSLPVGTWQVRVRGIDAATIEGYDSVRQVVVRAADRWRVTSSRLTIQEGRTRLEWSGQSSSGGPVSGPGFSALLATDAQLTQPVSRPTSGTSAFDLGSLPPGSYFVRITAPPAATHGAESEMYRLMVPSGWGTSILDVESALQPMRR